MMEAARTLTDKQKIEENAPKGMFSGNDQDTMSFRVPFSAALLMCMAILDPVLIPG